jgi:ABC-type amino acid transport substrate-binding protein
VKEYSSKPVVNVPYQFAVPKGDYKMVKMIDMALEELFYSRTIDNILAKYDPEGVYYARVQP